MEDIIDQPALQPDASRVSYAGFWQRLAALIVDGIALSPITVGLSYFNLVSLKSAPLMVLITLAGISYKPVMEYRYGATLGKMALKIKVTNLGLEKATIGEILLRNIFNLLPTLISLVFTFNLYLDPDFQSVTGFGDYSTYSQRAPILQKINLIAGLIAIIDGIVLLADSRKRSLHDKIGGTLVIEK